MAGLFWQDEHDLHLSWLSLAQTDVAELDRNIFITEINNDNVLQARSHQGGPVDPVKKMGIPILLN